MHLNSYNYYLPINRKYFENYNIFFSHFIIAQAKGQ